MAFLLVVHSVCVVLSFLIFFFFFFQAEDGIRDLIVTGVQTCALPIYLNVNFRIVITYNFLCRCFNFFKYNRLLVIFLYLFLSILFLIANYFVLYLDRKSVV